MSFRRRPESSFPGSSGPRLLPRTLNAVELRKREILRVELRLRETQHESALLVNFTFVSLVMYGFFVVLNKFVPMRVEEELEIEGLDQSEVAVTAYPDFSMRKLYV